MARKRRRFYAGIPTQKAASAESILDVIAVGNTRLPAFETYWRLYQKHPWVAACVNLIANTIAGDGYSVEPIAKQKASDADDPRSEQIDEFFREGFVGKITLRRAMFALAVDLLVFGCGYWRKKRAGKTIVALERCDPRYVLPKPNEDRTEILSFAIRKRSRFDPNSDISSLISAPVFQGADIVDPADMIFFTLGGGDQILGAPSALEHLDHTIGLDLSIRKYRASFFNNGAIPGGVLTLEKANADQARDVENRINIEKRGPENAMKTWVIAGGATYTSRGITGERDIDFVKGSELNRDEVCAVYHVPPGKLLFSGNALGSSGKAEDDATFQEQCVLPLEEAIYEILTRDLLNAEFDIEDLEMVPQRRSALRFDMFGAANQGVQIGMTGNEARDLVNLKPIDDPRFEMDVPLFIGIKGNSMQADEPVAQPENEAVNDSTDAQDEVAAKAKPRFQDY